MSRASVAFYTTALFVLLGTVVAWANVDDLEDIGPNFTPITTRSIDGVLVTISTSRAWDLLAVTYFDEGSHSFLGAGDQVNAPLNPANVSGNRFISTADDFNLDVPIVFDFSWPVAAFGLTTLDILEDVNTTPDAEVRLIAYDGTLLVDQHVRTGIQGTSGLDLDWMVNYENGITQAVLLVSAGSVSPGYGIDDLVVVSATVATENGTWGQVKSLYR